MKRFLMYFLLLILLVAIGARIAIPFISNQPDTLGVTDGEFAPCPDSPNCVNSFDSDEEHAIDSLTVTGSVESIQAALLQVIHNQSGTSVITTDTTYIHATYRSQIMGYIDDVEFLIDADAGLVHVRSASRLGHSDMGVNRARIEDIRTSLNN